MPSFFQACFELLHGLQAPIFRRDIYPAAGDCLLFFSIATAVVYYLIINRIRARYSRTQHWVIYGVINLVLTCTALFIIEASTEGLHVYDPASLGLLCIVALYSFIAFFLFSMIFKWFSPHASRTPF